MPEIDIVFADERWDQDRLQNLAQIAADAVLPVDASVSVLATNDTEIAGLNAQFRGKAAPTNVLSWPSEDLSPDTPGANPRPPMDMEIGDIALAFETCQREAIEQGKNFEDHLTHLLLHGMLHLLGYDHITDADAEIMEAIEIKALANMGISNPYEE
ncbi:MAG: rRNA maturation RNase YbeY [Planktomarina sp.]